MNKIPVWRTISRTYGFAISRYLPILGVVWLPFALMGVAAYFMILPAMAQMPAAMHQLVQLMHAHSDQTVTVAPTEFSRATGQFYLFDIIVFVLFAVISAGVTKEALGVRTGPRFVYLGFGRSELIVLAGYFVVFILSYVALAVVAIVGGMVAAVIAISKGAEAGAHADSTAFVASVMHTMVPVVLAAELVMLYFVIRLAYFIAPVAILEQRFGAWRSWELSRGNSWRMVAIVLGTMLPLILLQSAVIVAAVGPGFFSSLTRIPADPAAVDTYVTPLAYAMRQYFAFGWAAAFVLAPITYGLTFGQAVFAYRVLVPAEGQAPNS